MRHTVSPSVILTLYFLAGCQTYAPRPLDLESHAASWCDRRADDATVIEFVQLLRSRPNDDVASSRAEFDAANGIDLQHAEWVALVYNADLRLARADRGVAQAIADYAGLWDDPTINVDVLHILGSVSNPWIAGGAIGLTLPLSGRLDREKALAAAELDVADLRVLEQERETVRRLRQKWLEWSALHHRAALIDELLVDLHSIASTAGRLAELGEMLRSEASLFEIERTSREIEQAALRARLDATEEEIRGIMGLSPGRKERGGGPLRFIPQVAFPLLDDDVDLSDVQRIEQSNIELSRLRAAYRSAEERLHLEVRRQYPDITLGPQYESESGQSRIGFIGALPLPILNANRQGIAEAAAARERARAEHETAYERLVSRAIVFRSLRDAARQEQQQIESRLAPLVDQQVREARQLLDLGEGSPLALLEGTVRRHEAKLRALDAAARESEAVIELMRLGFASSAHQTQNETRRPEDHP